MANLNTYLCVGTPTVKENVTINQWVADIKNSTYSSQISEARQYKALYVATNNAIIKDEYDKIKSKLPTITYNSTFNGYRSEDNYIVYYGESSHGISFQTVQPN